MLLSRSLGRKVIATATAAVAFAFLYEATILDSRYAARQAELREASAAPAPGSKLRFTATAYCRGTTTASGVNVRNGIAAADPDLLPVGSVIQVDRLGDRYNGIYTVMDTGPAVQGRHIDIYMWNCNEARYEFGRRSAAITVLRLGWNPRASTPRLVDRLFRAREAAQPAATPPVAVPDATPAVAPPGLTPALKTVGTKESGS
jgi:3D (Asp-Asp-Asp) domain-containing protein